MATPSKRSSGKRAAKKAPARKRTARKAPARKRTPRKGAPKQTAVKKTAVKKTAVKKAAARKQVVKPSKGRKLGQHSKLDLMVLRYAGMAGTEWRCDLNPGVVKGVAKSFAEAAAIAKPGEGPTWSNGRPLGVGKPKLALPAGGKSVKRAALAEEQPECCYYINGRWVCW